MNDLIQHEHASVGGRSWHPLQMLSGLWSKRDLICATTRREIEARYKGSLGGLFWYVFNSLALLAIYSFVFRRDLQGAVAGLWRQYVVG